MKVISIAVAAMVLAVSVHAQPVGQLPANSVAGRLATQGPIEPVPFATLAQQLSAAYSWTDTSAVVRDPASHWSSWYTVAGHAIVHRMNRLLVGIAAHASSDLPTTTSTWVEDYIPGWTATSQLAAISSVGGLAISGASRTSDYHAWSGQTSGGAQASQFFAVNDDTTPGTTPIACGVCAAVLHLANVNGISVNQLDGANRGASIVTTPYLQVISGSTWPLLITSGAGTSPESSGTANVTAYIGLGNASATAPKGNKGIIFFDNILEPSIGSGGNGVAIEMARGQGLRWLNAGGTSDGEIYGTAATLVLNVPSALRIVSPTAGCNHTPTVSSETVTCSSDRSLKRAIENSKSAMDVIAPIRVRSVEVIASGERKDFSVVAQELQETHPGMVHVGDNNLLTVDQPNPWMLLKAIQELEAELAQLRAMVKTAGPAR